jgi:hypothetical protein
MVFIALVTFVIGGIFLFMQTAVFGARPSGKRLQQIELSPNYKNSAFQNESLTPLQAENFSFVSTLWKYFNSPSSTTPSSLLPFVRTDLKNLNGDAPQLVRFGHSSCFHYDQRKKYFG